MRVHLNMGPLWSVCICLFVWALGSKGFRAKKAPNRCPEAPTRPKSGRIKSQKTGAQEQVNREEKKSLDKRHIRQASLSTLVQSGHKIALKKPQKAAPFSGHKPYPFPKMPDSFQTPNPIYLLSQSTKNKTRSKLSQKTCAQNPPRTFAQTPKLQTQTLYNFYKP